MPFTEYLDPHSAFSPFNVCDVKVVEQVHCRDREVGNGIHVVAAHVLVPRNNVWLSHEEVVQKQKNAPREPKDTDDLQQRRSRRLQGYTPDRLYDGLDYKWSSQTGHQINVHWEVNWASWGAETQETLMPPRKRTGGKQVKLPGQPTLAQAQLQSV